MYLHTITYVVTYEVIRGREYQRLIKIQHAHLSIHQEPSMHDTLVTTSKHTMLYADTRSKLNTPSRDLYSRCGGIHIFMSIGFGHNRFAFVDCDGEY